MSLRRFVPHLAWCQVIGFSAGFAQAQEHTRTATSGSQESETAATAMRFPKGWADSLLVSLHSPALRALAAEVLERNPAIARAERLAAVAETFVWRGIGLDPMDLGDFADREEDVRAEEATPIESEDEQTYLGP